MTLQEAKSIARHLGLTLRKVRSGDYRVNFRDGNETTAYYTDNLEDAVSTASTRSIAASPAGSTLSPFLSSNFDGGVAGLLADAEGSAFGPATFRGGGLAGRRRFVNSKLFQLCARFQFLSQPPGLCPSSSPRVP